MNENNYIIEGGEEGKKRLDVLGSVLNPYTRQLLESIGSLAGKNILDLGCGSGTVSLMLAPLSAPGGTVTGVDFDPEIIELARQDAVDGQLSNAVFEVQDVYDIHYTEKFDIAYSRFLLSHLEQPGAVVEKMIRSLKKGGNIIIEDIDFSGHYCFPSSKAFDTYVACFTKAAQNNRQDPNIGLSLFQLLKGFHLENIKFDVIQPIFNKGAGKWMAHLTFNKIRQALLKQQLLTKQEIDDTLTELKLFTEDENSIISLPRIFRAWGTKK